MAAGTGNGRKYRRHSAGGGKIGGDENGNDQGNPMKGLAEQARQSIPFWQYLDIITQYQKSICENATGMWPWSEWVQNVSKLTPTNLWQDILRNWSFSVFNFTKEIRGNPELECKILTEVAGYGSQLGTIMDFLSVFSKEHGLDLNKLKEDELFTVLKFRDLLRKINKAKGRPELPEGTEWRDAPAGTKVSN